MADNKLKAVATANAYDQGNIATLDDAMTRRLVASTVLTESYGGDLGPINRLGYVGRYQAGAAWLVDAGYIDLDRYRTARNATTAREWEQGGGQLRFMRDARNWNDGLSLDRYLASDDLQDRAFRVNCNRSYQQAVRNGLLEADASPETVAGFLKSRHLSGYEGARNVIQGGRVIRDENGTSNYDYFHDITRNRDGLDALMSRDAPRQSTQQPQAPSPSAEPQTRTVRSFDDVMRVMLPPQGGVAPHMTSDYGPRTLNGRADHHGGVDFNYVGGQSGINLRHPVVRSPVSGVVVYGAGQGSYGTVKIRDDAGNVHEILHLDARSVRATDPPTRINAGDPIGTMGGRGPNGAGQYAQHVHYQVRDARGHAVDPETFWRNRAIEVPGGVRDVEPRTRTVQPHAAIADGVLRFGERGDDVQGLQQSLNRLGVRDADGRRLVEDGRFGRRTFEAVEAWQRTHGLEVDGIAGGHTLDSIGQRLPSGSVTATVVERAAAPSPPPSPAQADPLYAALRERLPATVSDEQAAAVTLAARRGGVASAAALDSVVVQDNTVFVRGTTPGFRAKVDLSQPLPPAAEVDAGLITARAPAADLPSPRRALAT